MPLQNGFAERPQHLIPNMDIDQKRQPAFIQRLFEPRHPGALGGRGEDHEIQRAVPLTREP